VFFLSLPSLFGASIRPEEESFSLNFFICIFFSLPQIQQPRFKKIELDMEPVNKFSGSCRCRDRRAIKYIEVLFLDYSLKFAFFWSFLVPLEILPHPQSR
jgi:hypothetical protein